MGGGGGECVGGLGQEMWIRIAKGAQGEEEGEE